MTSPAPSRTLQDFVAATAEQPYEEVAAATPSR